jgi:hypothetical protein
MTETQLTRNIVKALQQCHVEGLSIWWFKVHGGPMQLPGVPDLCCVVQGQAVFLEVKTEKGVVSPRQTYEMEQIREAGGIAVVVRSVEEAIQAVTQFA